MSGEHLNVKVEPLIGAQVRTFDSKQNYDFILRELRNEFNQLWTSQHVSPHIGMEGFTPIALLGKGAFGKVYLVTHIKTKQHYACKVMEKEHIVNKKQVIHILNEKKILSCTNFPPLIKLVFSSKDNANLYVGLPFLSGGELFRFHRVVGHFSENDARFYAAQVFLGLEYLHNVQVVYRDVKPENICFEKNGYIILTDFGFAKRVADRTMTLCGTPEYLAPEIIKSAAYGFCVDWWAFGILIYELVHGASPFSFYNTNVMEMYEKIIMGDFTFPHKFSMSLRSLVNGLLTVDVTRRLGTINRKEIKYHEWFKDTNWFGFLNQNVLPPYVPNIRYSTDVSHFGPPMEPEPLAKSKTNKHATLFAEF